VQEPGQKAAEAARSWLGRLDPHVVATPSKRKKRKERKTYARLQACVNGALINEDHRINEHQSMSTPCHVCAPPPLAAARAHLCSTGRRAAPTALRPPAGAWAWPPRPAWPDRPCRPAGSSSSLMEEREWKGTAGA
jgi:hypothetical protein